MTPTPVRSAVPRLGAVLCGAALTGSLLTFGTAGAAYAGDDGRERGITVIVPSPRPTAAPTTDPGGDGTPPTSEPTGTDGAGTGGGTNGDGGTGAGGGAGGVGGAGAGGVGAGPDAPTGTASAPAGTPPAATCVPKKPETPAEPATDGGSAVPDDDVYAAGQRVTIRSEGFKKGERVQLVWFAEPRVMKTFRADRKGKVEASWILDQLITAGPHTAQLTGWCGEIALASVLVASGDSASSDRAPAWSWWAGGGLGLAAGAFGAWQVFRVMRGSEGGIR